MTREELIEKMARAICLIDPRDDDPDAEVAGHMDDSGPRFPAWTFYRDQAEAALLSLEQSGFMIVGEDDDRTTGQEKALLSAMTTIGMKVSGGLTSFTSEAKHAFLTDIGRICVGLGFDVPALPSPPKSTDDSKEAESHPIEN